MIDKKQIKLDGKVNSINGIRYRYSSVHDNLTFYGISFLVDKIKSKKKSIKVTMQPDINHERPHLHVGDHEASFDINDGSLIVGKCDTKVQNDVSDWIINHREDLLDLWEITKAGKDREDLLEKIRNN